MRSTPIEERLEYLGLDDEAFATLRELRPLLEAHADELAERFYRHMLAFDELRVHFRDEQTKAHFIASRRHYLLSLSESDFGPEYLEARRTSGRLQESAGLSPAWISRLTAYYLSLLSPLLAEYLAGDPELTMRTTRALSARFALDMEIATEAYMERHEQGLAFMANELAQERRKLQGALEAQDVTLRETSERARVAEELASIATLVAGLAHEIGTPMSVIQGHAKMLERHVEGHEDGLWRLRTIQQQIDRITRIIHTLLRMAHPRHAEREEVPLAELIEQSLSFMQEKFTSRGVEVKQSLEPGLSAQGDRERLQQLLLNLFLNAADAMPEGGELRVDLSHAGDAHRIRVRDTGPGIAANDLPRVFEPFFTTKEAGQGNGLGLMVCKGIVSDHGGEIEVESAPGRGTTFSISLPPAPRLEGTP